MSEGPSDAAEGSCLHSGVCCAPLEDPDEVLLRQVLALQLDQNTGEPTSQSFKPGSNDGRLLSTRRESAGAQACFEAWANRPGAKECAGTWGVSVGECSSAELQCWDDSHDPQNPPQHASIDFRDISNGEVSRRARKLKDAAVRRGRLYP